MDIKHLKAQAWTALIALGFAGAVFAQAPSFDEVDQNGDGLITQDEAAVLENFDFWAADKNQDGVIDRAEYEEAVSGG